MLRPGHWDTFAHRACCTPTGGIRGEFSSAGSGGRREDVQGVERTNGPADTHWQVTGTHRVILHSCGVRIIEKNSSRLGKPM